MGINALRAHRTYTSNRKYIAPMPKRFINSSDNYTGTVTRLGPYTQPYGLDRNQLQLGWQSASFRNDQMSRQTDTEDPSTQMQLKTTHNGHETTELPVNKSLHDLEKFQREIEQVNTIDWVERDQLKAMYDKFTSDYLIHIKNLWKDSISKLIDVNDLAANLEGSVTIRLITSFSNQIVKVSRNHILNKLSITDDLNVITIDRFEIFITNITWEPFFNELLPKIYNLIIDINSCELSGYELQNVSDWLQYKLAMSGDNWISVKNNLIMNKVYSDYNTLLETVQFLGEGNIL